MNLFSNAEFGLDVHFDCFGEVRGLLHDPLFLKCTDLHIYGNTELLTNEEMQFLLEKTGSIKKLKLNCLLSTDFNNKILFDISVMECHKEGFFTKDDLKNMKCQLISVHQNTLTENQTNEFIHHWLKGGNPDLTRLKLYHFDDDYIPNWDVLLKTVKYSKFDGKRRARYIKQELSNYRCRIVKFDCANGFDFERSDGKLATVIYHDKEFYFIVWHDRFLLKV